MDDADRVPAVDDADRMPAVDDADRVPAGRPSVRRGVRRGARRGARGGGWRSGTAAAVLAGAVMVAACARVPDPAAATVPTSGIGPAGPAATVGSVSADRPQVIARADLQAIRRSIDAINAGAGGPVADQRAVLDRVVVPAEADAQRDCAAATHTIRLDPVYTDLRRPPADQAVSTSPAGSTADQPVPRGSVTTAPVPTADASAGARAAGSGAYLLPVLITIFTGDRITGTDLTTLRLFVTNGTARTGHVCVT